MPKTYKVTEKQFQRLREHVAKNPTLVENMLHNEPVEDEFAGLSPDAINYYKQNPEEWEKKKAEDAKKLEEEQPEDPTQNPDVQKALQTLAKHNVKPDAEAGMTGAEGVNPPAQEPTGSPNGETVKATQPAQPEKKANGGTGSAAGLFEEPPVSNGDESPVTTLSQSAFSTVLKVVHSHQVAYAMPLLKLQTQGELMDIECSVTVNWSYDLRANESGIDGVETQIVGVEFQNAVAMINVGHDLDDHEEQIQINPKWFKIEDDIDRDSFPIRPKYADIDWHTRTLRIWGQDDE